jgi:hypothetical protein
MGDQIRSEPEVRKAGNQVRSEPEGESSRDEKWSRTG